MIHSGQTRYLHTTWTFMRDLFQQIEKVWLYLD